MGVVEPDFGPRRAARLPALVWGILAATLLAWLQLRLAYVGQPHSFDSLVYARALWGLAHGVTDNSVVGLPTFSVHGHFHLYLLAPLARVVPALIVLIIAQAVAFGATAALVARACARAWGGAGAAWLAGAAFVVGTPLAVNPFCFDLHPGVAAVPVLTWAVLRARERGRLDAPELLGLALAALMREEWALVGAAAVLVWPAAGAQRVLSWRNAIAALGLAAYYAVFTGLVVEAAPGDWLIDHSVSGAGAVAERLEHIVESLSEGWWGTSGGWRLEALLLAAASLGGGALLGRRGWLVALPGLVLVLGSQRLSATVIGSHYPMFLAPGLLLAGVEGWARAARWRRRGGLLAGAVVALALAAYVASSALPGGGRFQTDYVQLASWDRWPPFAALANPVMDQSRALADAIPAEAGLVAEHAVGTGLAERRTIWGVDRLRQHLRGGAPFPSELEWALLSQPEWGTLGRRFVTQHEFRAVAVVPHGDALLARGPRASALLPPGADALCGAPLAIWPGPALALCDASTSSDGRWHLSVCRMREARPPETAVVMVGSEELGWTPVDAFGGLFNLRDLPAGRCASLATATAAPRRAEAIALDGDGRVSPVAVPTGVGVQRAVSLP